MAVGMFFLLASYAFAVSLARATYSASSTVYSIVIERNNEVIVNNSAILTGSTNSSATPITTPSATGNGTQLTYINISPYVIQVQVNSTLPFVGAEFTTGAEELFYGVWEYPFSQQITNTDVKFELKGVGNSEGINWSNARAPFFITSAGYGVYADTLEMGSFDFTKPGKSQFVFNSSSLTYYIILPEAPSDFKSIIKEYTALSSRIEMPPDSGYGPTFWSDDFEQDFHGSVSNAQENYYDVINHLYYNKIRATSMFADRPYGTGNMSFGNFDFDPKFYPTPGDFIANLSNWGFDFQVWVANRAFLNTQLYNDSLANNWLFPGYNANNFLGPALNLSIPAAYDYFRTHLSTFTDLGVRGYKIDRGEEGEMPVSEQNIQMSLFEQLCYENMETRWGSSNFYTFARSAVDRSRARTAIWNGDSHSNFTGLAYTVASGIRAGILGFALWSADTGGYVRGLNDPGEELWARWMQFSTWTPSYEIMIGTNHTPWYPPYSERLVSVLKETANQHTLLLPYIKSYTHQATQTGLPIIRALFLEYPNDKTIYNTNDVYAFGSEFLIAPIVEAGGSRSVYFPLGSSFLAYHNKSRVYAGGSTHEVSLEWEEAPVYVREGAIVPTGDIYPGNQKWEIWSPYLEIEVFPSFAVPVSRFVYFDGEANQTVEIVARTDGAERSVVLEYGSLGIPATVTVYSKTGTRNFTLEAGPGSLEIRDFESLFEG